MDMSKYRSLFIEESREHLGEVSRLVVDLEGHAEPASIVDDIFRHVHSVKGMAGSMGYEPIATLAHGLEDLVHARAQAGGHFEHSAIDLLFKGIDALGHQVECIADGSALVEYNDLVRALGTMAEQEPGAVVEASPSPSGPAKAQSGGSPAPPAPAEKRLSVVVSLSEASSAPAVRAFLVHRKLSEVVQIFRSEPTVEALRKGELVGREIRFEITGAATTEALKKLLESVPDVASVSVSAGWQEALQASLPRPQSGREGPSEPTKSHTTVRVRTEVLDSLIDSVGELFIARERLNSLVGDTAPLDIRAALDVLGARIRDIHAQVMTVRMMPIRTLLDRYPRLVRDLSRGLAKDVELEIVGGDIELDRGIVDQLDAPLIHTLRNAVDHGIESPSERMATNKPSTGKVVLTAVRDRDTVLVTVEDDGTGLDHEALRCAAVEKRLITAEQAEGLSARDCYFLICRPGFSTKTEVSDVSGRGVGMDAVRAKVESLGGSLDIESDPGHGTRFVFRLPLTLAIIPVLLVRAASRVFAIPAAKVVGVRELGQTMRRAGGGHYLSFEHALVPVAELAELLRLPNDRSADHVVVIEDGRDLAAVTVDGIVGYHEVVVKPLGDPLERLQWLSGATILGDGHPILILDLPQTLRMREAA